MTELKKIYVYLQNDQAHSLLLQQQDSLEDSHCQLSIVFCQLVFTCY